MPTQKVLDAHEVSFGNRQLVEASENCGCFYCCEIFKPQDIKEWVKEGDGRETALCPRCGIDSVLPSQAGFLVEKEFLQEMEKYWFGQTISPHT